MKKRYILYARKSTEGEERQAQSLDDQISIMTHIAKENDLKVIEVIQESKSAKDPYMRPKFDDMIGKIKQGKANAILTWEINRLSRNAVESGILQWMLQQNMICEIRTSQKTYKPDDNALILGIEGAMSNQYIIDLKTVVRRGMDSRRKNGVRPTLAPMGYLNGYKEIVKDPERFNFVRKMFDLMLTGNYTPPAIAEIANEEWGFRSRANKKLSRGYIYKLFTNIFYTGLFVSHEKEYQGIHPPMITLDEYDRVQFILGKRGKPRYTKREFPFTGTIRCGECGCFYTAQQNKKLLKNGKVNIHIYYRCTRRKTDINCSQRKHIRLTDLEAQIEQELESITILPQFKEWALKILTRENQKEIEDRTQIYNNLCTTIKRTQKKLDNLIDMRCNELINDEEYSKRKTKLNKELSNLREERDKTEDRADIWLELTEKTFEFATYAREAFIKGNVKTKTDILRSLGQSFTFLNGKLSIELNPWLIPIKKEYPKLENSYKRLKPSKTANFEFKNGENNEICNLWSG